MNIVITGGSGFLGKRLGVSLLQDGHQVMNFDLRPCDVMPTKIIDVRNKDQLSGEFSEVDVVFHLASLIEAGESVKHPYAFCETNIIGSLNVLEAMREQGAKKFIFSSSAAVYGEPIRTPVQEDDRTLPVSPYGVTKLAMEGLVSSYAYSHGMTGVALRYFNLYGPGEDHEPESHAIPRFYDQLMNNKEITIWGDGLHQRDYVFIDDIVEAHTLAMKLEGGFHYMNLSTQQSATTLEVLEILEEILGVTGNKKFFPPRPGDPKVLYASAEKAKKELGWEARTNLKDGLQQTVEWLRSRG